MYRYSSMNEFCKQLRKTDSKLVEPVPFPPKRLMGEVDIEGEFVNRVKAQVAWAGVSTYSKQEFRNFKFF